LSKIAFAVTVVWCCFCDFSNPYPAVGEAVGIKRKHDDDPDVTSIAELRECLLNTCISKLTAGIRLRRRRTLRHTVLINNLLRSLEHPASEPHGDQRARITARRRSSEIHPITTGSGSSESMTSTTDEVSASSELSIVEEQQMLSLSWKQQHSLEHLSSSWQPQEQRELLPSHDKDDDEVMSSPTATYCPLLPVDLMSGLSTSLSNLDTSQLVSDLETLDVDVSGDCSSYNSDLNFFEPPVFPKTAAMDIGFATSDSSAAFSISGNKETLKVDSGSCKMFNSGLDLMTVSVC